MNQGRIAPSNKYKFTYEFIGTTRAIETTNPYVQFNITADQLDHGRYRVNFIAEEYFFVMYVYKASATSYFDVTNRFLGEMKLTQDPNNTVREDGFISSQFETVHNVIISEKDKKLYDKAAYIRTFWFINCLYMGGWKKFTPL